MAVSLTLAVRAAQNGPGGALPDARTSTSLNGTGNIFLTASLLANPSSGGVTGNSVVAADFNGDGKADYAVTSAGCNTCGVSVFLGNGDGTFQAAQLTANLGGPHYVAAGDFNGDGKQDLVVIGDEPTNLTVPALFILTGNGDGTFALKTTLTGFSAPNSVVVGDFNGDGKLDMALVDQGNNTVSVFLGNSDGTFQAPVVTSSLGTGTATYAAAADFNKDGKLDLVIGDGSSNHVVVLLGNGNGSFQAARSLSFPGAQAGFDVAVGDFNGDGIVDIAASSPQAGVVNIFLGVGDGTFHAATSFAAGQTGVGFPNNLAVADFNKDGKLDLVTSINGPFNAGSSVSVMLGNGDGTFSAPLLIAANQAPGQLAVADFNGDGNPDWIAASTTGRFATLALGNGDGTLEAGVNYALGGAPNGVAVADMNNDGKLDVIAVDATSGDVRVLFGKGDGTFKPAVITAVPGAAAGIPTGDFNNDGKMDVVIGNSTGASPRNVTVLLGKGDGTFVAPATFTTGGSGEGQIVVGDFNGDGKLDIAVVNQSDNTLSILLGNGDGTFQAPKITGALASDGNLGAIAAADFNGDGKLDLAVPDYVGSTAGQVAILLGNGDGTFQTPAFLTSHGGSTWPAVGDFNKDGKLDLAVANQFGTVDVFLGNGNGTFSAATTLNDTLPFGGCCTGNPIPISLALADFNLDGNLDLVVGDFGSNLSNAGLGATNQDVGLQIFLGNGDGTFAAPQEYLAGAQQNPVVVGDFNGDGAPDVAAGDPAENFVSILINQTPPPVSVSPRSLTFANQLVNTTSAAQPLAVKNNGVAATTIAIGASGDFSQTNTCPASPATLAAGASCTINVSFSPAIPASRSGAITLTHQLPGSTETVLLSGTGVQPVVVLSGSSISFGSQEVGTSSAAQIVGLSNTGTAPLLISNMAFAGANSADFSQTNTCPASPATLAVGANCSISAFFKPTAAGARAASLSVTDDAPGSPQSVTLTGAGTAPAVMLSATSLNFLGQLVTTSSAAQSITLTNNGSATLNITSIAAAGVNAGDYSQTNTCGATLAPNANCAISVIFKPTAAGNRTANITISDDAAASPQVVALTGTGTDFSVDAAPGAPTTATITAGQTATYNLQVTAVSGFSGTVALACSGAPTEAGCTVSAASVTPVGGNAAAFAVSVTTTAPSGVLPDSRPRSAPPANLLWFVPFILIAVLLLKLQGDLRVFGTRRKPGFAYGLALAALFAMMACASGCAGGGGGGGGHNPGTPPGTYTLTITGTSSGVSHTRTLTLTVN